MLKSLIKLLGTMFGVLKPRVRRVDLKTNAEAWGTVEMTHHQANKYTGESITWWTVRWDDGSLIWDTMPSHNFVWWNGAWTLLRSP